MSEGRFLERFTALGGRGPREQASVSAREGLRVLSAAIPVTDRRALSAALPEELRSTLDRPYAGASVTVDELARHFAQATGQRLGPALEQLEVLCRVIGERLDSDVRARLERHLPDELSRFFEPPAHASTPVPHHPERGAIHHGPEGDRTLAGGKPGANHPLSDSRPDRAHSGSVAHWDDSRAERTLGGYREEEEEKDTLAEGRPGRRGPLDQER